MFFNLTIERYSEKKNSHHDSDKTLGEESFKIADYSELAIVLLSRCNIDINRIGFFEKMSLCKTFTIIDDITSTVIRIEQE